jgi:hypothetical protein
MTGAPVPVPQSPPPTERLLWRLRKGERIVEARVRERPHGCELRFIADGVLRWSQVFRTDNGELTQRALEKREDFERLGWTNAPSR